MTLTNVFDLLLENFYIGFIFWMVCTRTLMFHECSLLEWEDLSMGTNNYDLMNLVFDYFLKTLILAVSLEWYVLGLWYFTWVFLLTRLLLGWQKFWIYDTLVFDLLIQNFNRGFDISCKCSLWQDLPTGTNSFDLDLGVWPIYWILKSYNRSPNITKMQSEIYLVDMFRPKTLLNTFRYPLMRIYRPP
jgi:hypothetical protein